MKGLAELSMQLVRIYASVIGIIYTKLANTLEPDSSGFRSTPGL